MSDEPTHTPALETCGCCDGVSVDTPALIDNPPGLPAVHYRVGTHASFRSSMFARLATAELAADPRDGPGPPPPAAPVPDLRDADDFSAALIDSFAVVADVLTFYQERIANESYLGTATERRSILELAREIGYELDAGRAAAATLQLIIEEPTKLPPNVVVPASTLAPPLREVPVAAGTKVQSVPGPGEKPQTFETIEDVIAFPEWNEIRPRLADPLYAHTTSLFAAGKAEVKKGEVMVVHAKNDAIATVTAVAYDEGADLTRIDYVLSGPLIPAQPVPGAKLTLDQLTAVKRSLSDPAVRDSFASHAWSTSDLRTIARLQEWSLDELAETIRNDGRAYERSKLAFSTFSVHAAPFGHNAPRYDTERGATTDAPFVLVDSEFSTPTTMDLAVQGNGVAGRVYLDGVYQDVASPGIAIFTRAAGKEPKDPTKTVTAVSRIYAVKTVAEMTRVANSLSAKVTVIEVEPNTDLADFTVRNTAILAGNKRFDAPTAPNGSAVAGKNLTLEGAFVRLRTGQRLIISGERADARGIFVSEVCVVQEVSVAGARTLVTLESNLAWRYVRRSVTITANTAAATHGETWQEVLGSGDASLPYQSFALHQKPLTYVAAKTARGTASTLEVQINDVIWREVPTLYGRGPQERVYVTHRADDGTVTVQFGDGITGARLPTGVANVRAKYRKGIGLEGLVGPDKLTLLLSRPLGLKGATNPLPSVDAADPQPRDEARRQAPVTVLTLDRIVSLRDFEDFVRNYTGVAKALGSWMQGEERRGVFVTVAGQRGLPFSNTAAIEQALLTLGNKYIPVKVRSYRELLVRIRAKVTVEPDRLPEVVEAEIERTLREKFSFEQRSLGEPVHRSEVIALIHSVPGVVSVNLVALTAGMQVTAPLIAEVPEGDIASAENGAQLLVLDPRPVDLEVTR